MSGKGRGIVREERCPGENVQIALVHTLPGRKTLTHGRLDGSPITEYTEERGTQSAKTAEVYAWTSASSAEEQ